MFVEEHCTEHNVRVHATMLCVFQKWHISEDGEMIQMKSDANPNSIDAKVVHEIAHSALNNHHLPPGVQKKHSMSMGRDLSFFMIPASKVND
jgi:hypothetical protein